MALGSSMLGKSHQITNEFRHDCNSIDWFNKGHIYIYMGKNRKLLDLQPVWWGVPTCSNVIPETHSLLEAVGHCQLDTSLPTLDPPASQSSKITQWFWFYLSLSPSQTYKLVISTNHPFCMVQQKNIWTLLFHKIIIGYQLYFMVIYPQHPHIFGCAPKFNVCWFIKEIGNSSIYLP